MPDAIIFDFDGVVVDSEPIHFAAFTRIASERKLRFPSTFDGYKSEGFIGYDDRDAFRAMLGGVAGVPLDAAGEARIHELCELKLEVFANLCEAEPVSIPGILELWDELDKAQVPYAIASGAGRHDIDLMLKGLNRSVAVIVSCDDVERSKPDPESYALAVRKLGAHLKRDLKTERCLAIEDTPAGLRSARGAGLKTLGIPTTHTPEEIKAYADRVLETPKHVAWAQIKAMF